METYEQLDQLTSRELHDRAIKRAEHHLDVRFLWKLLELTPAAAAAAGQTDEADFDVSHWTSQIADVFREDDGELHDALRPVYLDYLVKHQD